MLESNLKSVNADMKTLVKDAQELFAAATSLSGDKADEMRSKGMRLLDSALAKAHSAQTSVVQAGKDAAATTDGYVKNNPWQAIAASAGVGLVLGVLLARK